MAKKSKRNRAARTAGPVLAAHSTLLEIPARPSAAATYATPASAPALPAVWACVDMIAATVLQIPVRASIGATGTAPLPEWLRRPERYNSGAATLPQLIEALTVGQALHGSGYLWAEPIGPQQWRLYPLDPTRVAVGFSAATASRPDRQRVYRLDGAEVPLARRFTTRDSRPGIVPVPHRLLPHIAPGVGPIQAAAGSVGAYIDTETYGADVFGDGVPAGILKTEQAIPQETAARYKREWMAGAADPVRVLGHGLDFAALKLNPVESAWLAARRFNGEEIARMFLIPAHKLNLSVSGGLTYSNPESLERDFLRGCIAGYVEPVERALSQLLPEGRNADEAMRVDFDYRGLMRTTTSERYGAYAAALAAGFLTVDEVRQLEGLPAMPADVGTGE